MKKTLIVVLILLMASSGLYAQMSFGGRAGIVFGFNNAAELGDLGKADPDIDVSEKMLLNFNAAVYGAFALSEALSIQAELNFMINQGYKVEGSFVDSGTTFPVSGEVYYTSLDIPILVKYSFLNDPLLFGAMVGPHISIPLGKATVYVPSEGKGEIELDNFATFGFTAGVFAGLPIGPGRLVGDLRFIFDFNAAEIDVVFFSMEIMKRRALSLTVGYELSF